MSALPSTWVDAAPGTDPEARRRARAALGVMLCFLVHGLVVSTFVSRLPGIKSALRLSDGALGLALLGTAFGSIGGIAPNWRAGHALRQSPHSAVEPACGSAACSCCPRWLMTGAGLFLGLLAYGAFAGIE